MTKSIDTIETTGTELSDGNVYRACYMSGVPGHNEYTVYREGDDAWIYSGSIATESNSDEAIVQAIEAQVLCNSDCSYDRD